MEEEEGGEECESAESADLNMREAFEEKGSESVEIMEQDEKRNKQGNKRRK